MKDQAIVDNYAIDKNEHLYWVSIIYVVDGHRIFQASFIPCIGEVKEVEKDPLTHISDDVFLLMANKAIEFFKEKKVFRYA